MASETLSFETADGLSLIIDGTVFAYETFPGDFGAPPINYITRSGYKQHGSTEIDYLLQSRTFDIDFFRAAACDRTTYWQNRAALLEIFRPNRGGQMTFRVNRVDGSARALKVRATPGLRFGSQRTNDFNVRETVNFTAFDPVWFDPTRNSLTVAATTSNDLVFPITFPIQFGASGTLYIQSLTYAGTWATYPTLILTGPYTNAVISNITTGFSIYMTIAIAAGETRTIDLTPGSQSIVDQNGNDAFSDLGPISNLVNFNILPDPEIAGGVQTIQATLYGASGASGFSLQYYNRYIGI